MAAATANRLPNTASWIYKDLAYQSWRLAPNNEILWLNGSPGKGKTTIAMALIDEFRQKRRTTGSLGLSFFLCDHDDYRRNNATAIVRGLLYHILGKYPQARHFLRREYNKQKESLVSSPNAIYSLWRVLNQVIQSLVSRCFEF